MATLKNIYLDGENGIIVKLNAAFELGRRFILPQYYNVQMENAVDISTTTPHFTIKNSGLNSQLSAGFTVKYISTGVEIEKTVESPLTSGSTFDVTEAPSSSLTDKCISYSSLRPGSYGLLVADLLAAAAAGKKTFDITILTSDNPAYLRLQGDYMKSYFAGIYYAMSEENIFSPYEVTLSLDVSDTIQTNVKFSFSF